MADHIIDMVLFSSMDTFPTHADITAVYYNTCDPQDIEPSILSKGLDKTVCVTDNFQTDGIDLMSVFGSNSSHSPSDSQGITELCQQTSVSEGACNYLMSPTFPATPSTTVIDDIQPKLNSIEKEAEYLYKFKPRARKMFVPDSAKDERYWKKRNQNTNASKKSRYAKRMRENQILQRTLHLEKENASMKEEADFLRAENCRLEEALRGYICQH